MFTLGLYDVRGIQSYIFQSSRLRENIGASALVEWALTDFLQEAVRQETNQCVTDWQSATSFEVLNNPDIEAEIVYTGGGNALIAFRNAETARKVTITLSRILLERAPGLNVVSVQQAVSEGSFAEAWRSLQWKLNRKKAESLSAGRLGGISITQLCPNTHLPVSRYEPVSGEFLPAERDAKRKAAENLKPPYLVRSERFSIPLEMDNLGGNEGESYIGIVHIDGNSSGNRLKNILSNVRDFEEAVQKVRQFASQTNRVYKEAYQHILDRLVDAVSEDGKIEQIQLKEKDKNQYYLPIRDIVLNGDDVTFVCDGRLALYLAYLFLSYLNGKVLDLDQKPFSACAGIAIVKAHFPFFRAYQIAEQCCQSAKERAKKDAKDRGTNDHVRCWMDFHIVSSGMISNANLNKLREKHYWVANGGMEGEDCYLLWRPWLVCNGQKGNHEEKYDFRHFIRIHQSFEQWPNNKRKRLKNLFAAGEQAVSLFLQETRSRNLRLPAFGAEYMPYGFDANHCTPYYDVLEMKDFLIWLEGAENEDQAAANV